jgi:hypothetical protein
MVKQIFLNVDCVYVSAARQIFVGRGGEINTYRPKLINLEDFYFGLTIGD